MKKWTDDFSKFRKKVEPIFGRLEFIAEHYPDIFVHQVLSHGFMEYAGVRRLSESIQERIRAEKGAYNPKNQAHKRLYHQYMKGEFLAWARERGLPEHLLAEGWEAFVND